MASFRKDTAATTIEDQETVSVIEVEPADCGFGGEMGRRSWIVETLLDDGQLRKDVLNACSAEGAASAAMSFGGVSDLVSVRLRDRP